MYVQEGPNAGKRDASTQPLVALKTIRAAKLRAGAVFGTKLDLDSGDYGAWCSDMRR